MDGGAGAGADGGAGGLRGWGVCKLGAGASAEEVGEGETVGVGRLQAVVRKRWARGKLREGGLGAGEASWGAFTVEIFAQKRPFWPILGEYLDSERFR